MTSIVPEYECPHCGAHAPDPGKTWHTCRDKRRWTDEERDALLAIMKRAYPAAHSVPTSEQFAERFGKKQRR